MTFYEKAVWFDKVVSQIKRVFRTAMSQPQRRVETRHNKRTRNHGTQYGVAEIEACIDGVVRALLVAPETFREKMRPVVARTLAFALSSITWHNFFRQPLQPQRAVAIKCTQIGCLSTQACLNNVLPKDSLAWLRIQRHLLMEAAHDVTVALSGQQPSAWMVYRISDNYPCASLGERA